jgi:hypothetical protein
MQLCSGRIALARTRAVQRNQEQPHSTHLALKHLLYHDRNMCQGEQAGRLLLDRRGSTAATASTQPRYKLCEIAALKGPTQQPQQDNNNNRTSIAAQLPCLMSAETYDMT